VYLGEALYVIWSNNSESLVTALPFVPPPTVVLVLVPLVSEVLFPADVVSLACKSARNKSTGGMIFDMTQ